MLPTLRSKNILITDRISPRLNKLKRGDIIILRCPQDASRFICKRVAAMPGDTVIMHTNTEPETEGKVKEQVISHNMLSHIVKDQHLVIPKGYLWIEGDNSQNSLDSRFFGPVSQGLIRSKVVARLWPFSTMTFL